jgi:hypothetical protein
LNALAKNAHSSFESVRLIADCFGKPENGYFELASGMPERMQLRKAVTPKKTKSLAGYEHFWWGILVAERQSILPSLRGQFQLLVVVSL